MINSGISYSSDLLRFQESSTENYEDVEIERLDDSCIYKNNAIEKANGPFSHTDLIIFNNGISPLPLNGITLSEYNKIKKLFESIINNKTNIRIDGDDRFNKIVFDNLAIALSREQGRKLLSMVAKAKNCLPIVEGKESEYSTADGKLYLKVDISDEVDLVQDAKSFEKFAKSEIYIDLLHELLHFQHDQEPQGIYNHIDLELLSSDLDTTEEQVTITGIIFKVNPQEYFKEQEETPSLLESLSGVVLSVRDLSMGNFTKSIMGIFHSIMGGLNDNVFPISFDETK